MNKKTLKSILILIIVIAIELLLTTVSNAALSISTSKSTVSPGESFSVTVSVSNNEAGAINLSASNGTLSNTYIDLMSQPSVTVSCIAGNSGTVSLYASGKVANYNTETEGQQSASKTIQISTPVAPPVNQPNNNNSGTTNKPKPNTGNSGTSANKPTTTTNQPETKSNDATLKSLVVEGYELYPAFETSVKEYNLRVTNDITSVKIIPTVNNSKANYTIEGTIDDLQVGENLVNIKVTAEDGTTANYSITITREREGLNVQHIKISYIDEDGNKQELELNPVFNAEIFEYTLKDLSYLVKKLDVEVLANLEEAKIEITGNEEIVEGENIITITVTIPSQSEEDDEVLTYKIKVNREKEPVITLIGRIKNWFKGITGTIGVWFGTNQYNIVMGALILCCACMMGMSIYLVIEYRKYRLLMEKIAQITRMNNTNQNITKVVSTTENINNKVEEIKNEDNDDGQSKGKHF